MSGPRKRGISPKHLTDLRASGLNDETIRLAQVYTESDPKAIGVLVNWDGPARTFGSCLVFPFFDPDGNQLPGYSRVKPDKPQDDGTGRPAKYLSPKGRPNAAYLPPRARGAVKSPNTSLVITEGEKKALAADQYEFATIGLAGVWGWQKKREGDGPRELLPDLAEFVWRDRSVYIVFDSDAAYKPLVQQAEWELAVLLTGIGARVRVVRLPSRLGGPKVGLDDFLLTHSAQALDNLLLQSGPARRPQRWFTNIAERMSPEKPAELDSVPRGVGDIAAELVGRTGGWPRRVSTGLVIPDAAGGVREVGSHHDLFSYAGGVFDTNGVSGVRWNNKHPGAVSPPVLFAYLMAECERFDRSDRFPHVPAIPGVLYTCDPPADDGTGETLDAFLAFFNPATEVDRSLLRACLMTLLWGGPPGRRPAFLFEGDTDDAQAGRGVGKSTAASKLASVFGGAVAIDAAEPFTRTRSRLLTPDAGGYRVLLMDNVKTFRVSNADLESLITSPDVNGHRLYHGQAAVPNYYTLFLTINGASLSRDVAQRVIPIRLARKKILAGWEADVDEFVRTRRDRLIADLAAALRGPGAPLDRVTRWGVWEQDVLSRVPHPNACMASVEERTGSMDADDDDSDRIRDTLAHVLKSFSKAADRSRVLINSPALVHLIQLALNERNITANGASALVKSLGVKGFAKSNRNGARYWLWSGDDARGSRHSAPPVLHWDADSDKWNLSGQQAESELDD